MKGIDPKLIQKNKKILLEEKERLERLLSRIAKRDKIAGDFHPKYPEFGSKDDENAAEVTVYETNIAEGADLKFKLRQVEGALTRIAKGTYGVCQRGGEVMPIQRLEAVPEAENCIEHERQKK